MRGKVQKVILTLGKCRMQFRNIISWLNGPVRWWFGVVVWCGDHDVLGTYHTLFNHMTGLPLPLVSLLDLSSQFLADFRANLIACMFIP